MQGITKMLMVKIPYFQEVVIMSFECGHCGNRNNEIQSVGPVQTHGIRIEVRVTKEVFVCLVSFHYTQI